MGQRVALFTVALLCILFSRFAIWIIIVGIGMALTKRQTREPSRVNYEPLVAFAHDSTIKSGLTAERPLPKAFKGLSDAVINRYIRKWFTRISNDPTFPNETASALEAAFAKIIAQGNLIDWHLFLSCKCLPLVVRHFNDYVKASEKVMVSRGGVVDLAEVRNNAARIARVYTHAHPGMLAASRIEALAYEITFLVVDSDLLNYQPIKRLITDMLRNLILQKIFETLSDPHYLNRRLVDFAESQLADVEKVNRMRRVIQQSLSAGHILPKVSADSHPADFEKFIQEVNAIKHVEVAEQLEKSLRVQIKSLEGATYKPANALFKRRLEEGKKAIDKRIAELSPATPSPPPDASLQDVLADSQFTDAFRRFMAGKHDGRFQLFLDIINVHKGLVDPMGRIDNNKGYTRDDLLTAKGVCRHALLEKFGMDPASRRALTAFVESNSVSQSLYMSTERTLWAVKDELAQSLNSALVSFKMSPNYAKYIETKLAHTENAASPTPVDGMTLDNKSRENLTEAVQDVLETKHDIPKGLVSDSEDDVSDDDMNSDVPVKFHIDYEERLRQTVIDIEQMERQSALLNSLLSRAESANDENEQRVFQQSKDTLEREISRKYALKARYTERLRHEKLYGKVTLTVDRWTNFNDGAGEYTTYLVDAKVADDPDGGWVIPRRFSQFNELRKILKRSFPAVSEIDFPAKRSVLRFQPRHFIEARRALLSHFLQELSKNPAICDHLAFRMFLSSYQFPETYYEIVEAPSYQGGEGNESKQYEYATAVESVCGAFLTLFNVDQKSDWIKGKAIVTIVQQVLGGTIDKRIKDVISNLIQKIPDVVESVTDSVKSETPVAKENTTAEDRLKTREYADALCYRLIRHWFSPVVGPSRSRYCATILMELIQSPQLNRHVLLDLLDLLIQELLLARSSADGH